MKTAMVFLILLLVLLTQDFVEVVTFLMFLLLSLYFSMLIASIRRYDVSQKNVMNFLQKNFIQDLILY